MKIKSVKSGSALFMYVTIGISVITFITCFWLHYIKGCGSIVLWTGIAAFMITYHFWLRIIMGNVSKFFGISYKQSWFKEQPFERKLYKLLRVKKWKGKALTYNPEAFSLKNHTFDEIANTMAKSETDHWINEIISIVSILFSLVWGEAWIFVLTAIAAMIFDAQFIVIQRYNRPRMIKAMERRQSLIHKNVMQEDFYECNSGI